MNSANDWANPDSSKNMTLDDAVRLDNEITGAFTVQIVEKYVRTTGGNIISERELRDNQFISPLPVNMCGKLSYDPSAPEINLCDLRNEIQSFLSTEDPVYYFRAFLEQMIPNTDINYMFSRIPAVQQLLIAALGRIN